MGDLSAQKGLNKAGYPNQYWYGLGLGSYCLSMQGDLIRELRKKKNLSQAKLARLLGIKQAKLSIWETNKVQPSPDVLRRIITTIEKLDDETIANLNKRKIRKKWDIQALEKTFIRSNRVSADADRKKRLPFLYFNVNEVPYRNAKGISLFSGIGGMSLGFRLAGIRVVGSVEIYAPFRTIYEANFPDTRCLGHDIQEIDNREILSWKEQYGEIYVIFGGPPCQGFSLAGKRDRFDPRNQLYQEFARIASVLQPKVIVMENVRLITSMKTPEGEGMLEAISAAFETAGYECQYKFLNAQDYGVPQSRSRIFLIGVRKDLDIGQITFPPPTHRPPGQKTLLGEDLEPCVTFREATGDLESLAAGECSRNDPWHKATPHPPHVVKMLEGIPEGMSAHDNPDPNLRPTSGYNTTYKRIKWDEPCSTISTNFNMISGCRHVHPSDTRALTVREAMRVQTFPDQFKIFGRIDDVRKGIGNAVPPLLAKKIAEHLLKVVLP